MTHAPRSDNHTAIPALSPERPVIWPPRTHQTLPNGLEVVLVESRTIPKFTAQLFFRSGNAVTATDAPGLAEITASVVRTGTVARSSRQIEEDLRRMGADLSTAAGADTSGISCTGLVDFSSSLLELIAELAHQASFPPAELERERRQLVEGLRIERTTPAILARERLRKVLFGKHPYGTVSPTEAQAESYQLEQLKDFYREHYRPGNALLVMVGDFSPQDMLAKVVNAFDSLPAGAAAEAPNPPLPDLQGRRVYIVHLPGTVQAQVWIGNRAITRNHPDWLALTLANTIFGGAFNSRLVMNIREQKGYSYSPGSMLHPMRQHGYFSIHAAVRNDVVAATLTEMLSEVDRMRSTPVGENELADARNYICGVFSLGLATQNGLAGQLASCTLERLPEDYLETYRERILRLTAADVLGAAQKYFDAANAQIIIVGDRAQFEAQAGLFGQPEVYDALGNRI